MGRRRGGWSESVDSSSLMDMGGMETAGGGGAETWATSPGGSQSTNDTLAQGQNILNNSGGGSGGSGGGPGSFADITAGAGTRMSEDYARFGQEEFERWKPYLGGGCPPNMPYRSMRGAEGCYEKPTECPPGQGPSGPDETDPCTSAGYSDGGGGGGGGGRASGPVASNAPAASVAPRPDYKLQNNYLTQRGMGQGWGPGSKIGTPGAAPTPNAAQAALMAPAVQNPVQTQLLIDQNKKAPGSQTIPSSVLWKTGM